MSDDGFHEIQLNGKQLVFLFMAATVVSVVIFLCGVMVGRGVRGDQPVEAAATDLAAPAQAATAPEAEAGRETAAPATARTDPGTAPVPEPAEDESVYKALTSDKPTDENLKSAARPASPSARKSAPKTAPATEAAPPSAVTSGFAVQVTALRDRSDAEAIVKRLVAKGYQAYVLNPLPGKPPVYRVQVGRYQSRADADRIAARLKKEEQFSPWVTR